jgi:hypothetical protein
VPVKYSSESSGATNNTLNVLIGTSFLLLLFQLYRTKHIKGGPTNTGTQNKGSGLGGRGGMNDMFSMGKSNV